MNRQEKIDYLINKLESISYSIYCDTSDMDNNRSLLSCLKDLKSGLANLADRRFYDGCPTMLPQYECQSMCKDDYTQQLKCWELALQDDSVESDCVSKEEIEDIYGECSENIHAVKPYEVLGTFNAEVRYIGKLSPKQRMSENDDEMNGWSAFSDEELRSIHKALKAYENDMDKANGATGEDYMSALHEDYEINRKIIRKIEEYFWVLKKTDKDV